MKIKKKLKLSDYYYNKQSILSLNEHNLIDIKDYRFIDKIISDNKRCFFNNRIIDYINNDIKIEENPVYFFAKDFDEIVLCEISGFNNKNIFYRDIRIRNISSLRNDNMKFKCLL